MLTKSIQEKSLVRYQFVFRNCDGGVNVCGEERGDDSKFQIKNGVGSSTMLYNEASNTWLCRGKTDSSNEQVLVARSSPDPNECSMKFTNIENLAEWLEGLDYLEDLELYYIEE